MSAVYPKFREQLLLWAVNDTVPAGGIDFYVVCVDSSYVYDVAHNDLADVGAGPQVSTPVAVTTPTFVDGWVDFDDVPLAGLTISDGFDAVIVYAVNGADSYLAAYIDSSADGSIPQTIGATTGTIRLPVGGLFRI